MSRRLQAVTSQVHGLFEWRVVRVSSRARAGGAYWSVQRRKSDDNKPWLEWQELTQHDTEASAVAFMFENIRANGHLPVGG